MDSRRRTPLRHRPALRGGPRTPPAVRLTLLGGFELELGGRGQRVPPHVERLVAFLALHDLPLRRSYVSGRLWLEGSQEQAFGSLRTTLWRVRRIPAPVVEATSTHLALAPSVAVDARALAEIAERALHRRAPLAAADVERLAEARELLPDWYDDWVSTEREQLGQIRVLALEATCEQLVAAGRYREATTTALAAVRTDPLRESARLLLISTCLRAGNRAEAVRQLDDFRARLKRDVGLDPSIRMLELARRLGAA